MAAEKQSPESTVIRQRLMAALISKVDTMRRERYGIPLYEDVTDIIDCYRYGDDAQIRITITNNINRTTTVVDDGIMDMWNLLQCYAVVIGEKGHDVEAVVPPMLRNLYNSQNPTSNQNPDKLAHSVRVGLDTVWAHHPSESFNNGWAWGQKWLPLLDAVANQMIARAASTQVTQSAPTISAPQQAEITLAPDTVCRLVGINPSLMPRALGTARRNGMEWEIEWSFPDVRRGEWPDLMSAMSQRGGWRGGGKWGNLTGSLPDTMSGRFIVSDAALNNAIVGQSPRESFIPSVPRSEPIKFLSAEPTPIAKPAASNDRFSNLELDPPTPEDIAARDAAIAADLSKINRRKQNVLSQRIKIEDAIKSVDVPDRFALIEADAPKATADSASQTSPQDIRRRVLDIVDMSGDDDSIAILRLISQGDA